MPLCAESVRERGRECVGEIKTDTKRGRDRKEGQREGDEFIVGIDSGGWL